MRPTRRIAVLLAAATLACATLTACGDDRNLAPAPPLGPEAYVIDPSDVPSDGQYLRYVPSGARAGGLDIALTDFAPSDDGPTVHLVGVVHVADALYYEEIQRVLDGYDEVLYEGVIPADKRAVDWQKEMLEGSGELGDMQQEIASWFGFRYQMEAIDYGRRNLVHADMTLEEFMAAGAARLGFGGDLGSSDATDAPDDADEGDDSAGTRGSRRGARSPSSKKTRTENVLGAWRRMRAFGRLLLGQPGPIQSLARRAIAEAMGTADIGANMDLVPGFSELVLFKRNGVVMEVLKQERAKRATAKGSLAVFYGAAHMKDLAKRLEDELGYRRVGGRWLRAWALRPALAR